MSERVDYCKRLLKKALILQNNMGKNERKTMEEYLDDLEGGVIDYLVDDATPCKCKSRSDVVLMGDRKYCCDCLHYLEVK